MYFQLGGVGMIEYSHVEKFQQAMKSNASFPVPTRLLALYNVMRQLSILVACMYVCCECCVLSVRGLRVGFITRLEESYRVWCV
jgi:hypothetical protein